MRTFPFTWIVAADGSERRNPVGLFACAVLLRAVLRPYLSAHIDSKLMPSHIWQFDPWKIGLPCNSIRHHHLSCAQQVRALGLKENKLAYTLSIRGPTLSRKPSRCQWGKLLHMATTWRRRRGYYLPGHG
ncbi:hypothetical protein BV20DRAFT_308403 [Pilatotrama ljubarskyi]|nr:hypothetical protein BV20DRAFT_308403 [Pilatotrama ljubarskyi]